jgi:DNA-binding CsgD family transcriptional regulator
MPPAPPANAVTLTDAQRRYLRLVADGLTSKQIAQSVGGSHHTINVQIGVAMRILGATSRQQAAAMLDTPPPPSYEPSYDAPAIAGPAPTVESPSQNERFDGDRRWGIPVATTGQPINIMGAGQRLGWVLMIAATVTLLLAGLLSGVTSLLTSLGRLM